MITNKVIEEIYKKYGQRPKSVDCLDFVLLIDKAGIMHDIFVDPEAETLRIGSLPEDSPFHTLRLKNINAFIEFEEWVAVVLHSAIIFLNKKNTRTSIHLKEPELSLWDRIRGVGRR
ncbi:MAG: hypothetical protein NC102_09040 [Clostridium sp.]|nr:hypothetical protein [Clostridium sp.]